MKPTLVRRILAQKWAWSIAFFGGYLAMTILLSLFLLTHGRGFLVSLLLGSVLGVITNHIICRTLFCLCIYANGAPYKIGDSLLILCGKHCNKTAKVYKIWSSRNQLLVDLGGDTRDNLENVFSFNEVCKLNGDVGNIEQGTDS